MQPRKPLRVVQVCQPLDAGVPQHVVDLVASLPGEYEFDVVCPAGSMLRRELAGDGRVRLHPLGAGRRPGPADLAAFVRLLRLTRRADVIHAHSSKAGFLARLAAALVGRRSRCVFTPHCWSFWAADGLERRLYLLLERLAARWCAAIVAVSAHERDAGLAAGVGREEQYVVVRNGIHVERFEAEPEPVAGRVLVLGRLAPQKRPELALRAFALLERPGAELHLAGSGPLQAAAERLARELGLEGTVRFLGDRRDAPVLLAGASCLLLTSRYEGCPISVLEAMAAGVPVVAVESGGIGEVVADGATGLLVPADPEAIAVALRRLLDDPPLARALGAEGRRVARERFRRDAPAAELHELYGRLAGR